MAQPTRGAIEGQENARYHAVRPHVRTLPSGTRSQCTELQQAHLQTSSGQLTSRQRLSHEKLRQRQEVEQLGVETEPCFANRRNTDQQGGFDKVENGSRTFHERRGVPQQRAEAAAAEYLRRQHLEAGITSDFCKARGSAAFLKACWFGARVCRVFARSSST